MTRSYPDAPAALDEDYIQESFQKALFELVNDPRAPDIDKAKALAVALSTAREEAFRIIKTVLIAISPTWRDHTAINAVMARIGGVPGGVGRRLGRSAFCGKTGREMLDRSVSVDDPKATSGRVTSCKRQSYNSQAAPTCSITSSACASTEGGKRGQAPWQSLG